MFVISSSCGDFHQSPLQQSFELSVSLPPLCLTAPSWSPPGLRHCLYVKILKLKDPICVVTFWTATSILLCVLEVTLPRHQTFARTFDFVGFFFTGTPLLPASLPLFLSGQKRPSTLRWQKSLPFPQTINRGAGRSSGRLRPPFFSAEEHGLWPSPSVSLFLPPPMTSSEAPLLRPRRLLPPLYLKTIAEKLRFFQRTPSACRCSSPNPPLRRASHLLSHHNGLPSSVG